MLRGVLLPKKGDLSQLANYRPLSIAAAAFRILGGAVSNRLQPAAAKVVHTAQIGFIVGRSSSTNVITLALPQHAVKTNHIAGPLWILNLDQQKAYDRVLHEWLIDCLSAYGFGPRFLIYIKEIYHHPSVRQSLEGFLTDPIPLKCGILQGDPMSCFSTTSISSPFSIMLGIIITLVSHSVGTCRRHSMSRRLPFLMTSSLSLTIAMIWRALSTLWVFTNWPLRPRSMRRSRKLFSSRNSICQEMDHTGHFLKQSQGTLSSIR